MEKLIQYLACYFLLLLGAVMSVAAQSTPTGIHSFTETAVKAQGSYDNDHENINLVTGNLNVTIPFFTLPGRNGLNVSLGLEYDSKNFKLDEVVDDTGFTRFYWKHEERWPKVGEIGWRLNIPYIVSNARLSNGGGTQQINSVCNGPTIVTLSDGAKYSFNNRLGCEPYVAAVNITDTIDGQVGRLDITNRNDNCAQHDEWHQGAFPFRHGACQQNCGSRRQHYYHPARPC